MRRAGGPSAGPSSEAPAPTSSGCAPGGLPRPREHARTRIGSGSLSAGCRSHVRRRTPRPFPNALVAPRGCRTVPPLPMGTPRLGVQRTRPGHPESNDNTRPNSEARAPPPRLLLHATPRRVAAPPALTHASPNLSPGPPDATLPALPSRESSSSAPESRTVLTEAALSPSDPPVRRGVRARQPHTALRQRPHPGPRAPRTEKAAGFGELLRAVPACASSPVL